jgi:hypothetical protein
MSRRQVTRKDQLKRALGMLGGVVLAGVLTRSYTSWNAISMSTIAFALIVCWYGYRWLRERRHSD